jgi:hypothetical protein
MRKKVFSILFVILLGSSFNVYFSKTGTLDVTAGQNVAALAAGDDFSAQNTGPARYTKCDPTPDSALRKYCDCSNSEPCTQVLTCP